MLYYYSYSFQGALLIAAALTDSQWCELIDGRMNKFMVAYFTDPKGKLTVDRVGPQVTCPSSSNKTFIIVLLCVLPSGSPLAWPPEGFRSPPHGLLPELERGRVIPNRIWKFFRKMRFYAQFTLNFSDYSTKEISSDSHPLVVWHIWTLTLVLAWQPSRRLWKQRHLLEGWHSGNDSEWFLKREFKISVMALTTLTRFTLQGLLDADGKPYKGSEVWGYPIIITKNSFNWTYIYISQSSFKRPCVVLYTHVFPSLLRRTKSQILQILLKCIFFRERVYCIDNKS